MILNTFNLFTSCWSSLSITYVSSSESTFFNKSSASLWEQIVSLSLPIYSYTPMGMSLCKYLSKKSKIKTTIENKAFKLTFMYIADVVCSVN